MKKILILVGLTFVMLVISNIANGQTKKGEETVTEITVATPTMSLIYQVFDESGNPLGTLDLQIYDRKGQFDDINIRRMVDQVKGNDPIRPKIKLIALPEIDARSYKIAESMDEIYMEVDNRKVLLVDYMVLLEAMRVKYN
jgi:hypothetical protein